MSLSLACYATLGAVAELSPKLSASYSICLLPDTCRSHQLTPVQCVMLQAAGALAPAGDAVTAALGPFPEIEAADYDI